MEPLPASARVPPGPPRPPAPPTTDTFPPRPWGRPPAGGPARAHWWEFLADCWRQLMRFTWPTRHGAARASGAVLIALALTMIVVVVAGAGFSLLQGR